MIKRWRATRGAIYKRCNWGVWDPDKPDRNKDKEHHAQVPGTRTTAKRVLGETGSGHPDAEDFETTTATYVEVASKPEERQAKSQAVQVEHIA